MIDMKEGARTSSKNDNKNSKFNNGHVLIVCDLLNLLLQENTGIRSQDIVVITPYLAQHVRHIRTLKEAARYNKSLENVIVSTVDKFQGQESNIVVGFAL
jgi:superfamily I DNA and/or RNA helicase